MIGFSPIYPLQKDNEIGAYSVTQTLGDVAKQNFINLMLTSPGERVMHIGFGVGLRRYLFEPNTKKTQARIASRIQSQVATYLPFVQVSSIDFNKSQGIGNNPNLLTISIAYSIPSLGTIESFTIGNTNTI